MVIKRNRDSSSLCRAKSDLFALIRNCIISTMPGIITCKAAICLGVGKPVTVEEIQVDPPKATEVRVKMLCASVCHTDISSTQGFPCGNFPLALGHEGVGVVETIGDRVTNLKEGDVVIPTYIGECRECVNCVSEKTNLCLTYPVRLSGLMPDNTSRMSIRGQRLHHVLSCATWSEYMVIDANYVLKVDPNIDLAHASFISCGFSTGFGAAWKEAKVESGSSVAVFGLGAVGLGAISGAKIMGATKIIGIDKNEMKKEKGEAFGMTDFINPGDSAKSASELVKELSGGMGVDYSFECTGVGPLLTESLEATKVGTGTAIAIGTGSDPIVPFGLASIMYGRTLKGSVFGGLKAISDLSIIANKCQKEEFPLQELFTHEVPLADINKAFELLKQPNCVKVVIKM
ncbi:8-hydroxygeraniol oxidoreductase-like [Gastrolobium bilobum]|uniref:8-hydroxygeraniol oxidoreductase-like n=1 Tax=Gastrolobium bilobum TaxID=150636 RepID=UPI002AAF1815|nr:8-hydroxygeraniol oxidoreductase-like [Gastrolobium bilobum]